MLDRKEINALDYPTKAYFRREITGNEHIAQLRVHPGSVESTLQVQLSNVP